MSRGPHGQTQAVEVGALSMDGKDFLLVSIRATSAPSGCAGPDWFVYKIAQGENIITGYRRGDQRAVASEVETIVASLNSRRRSMKAPKAQKPGRKPAGAGQAGPVTGSDDLG